MKFVISFFILVFVYLSGSGQSKAPSVEELFQTYEKFREPSIQSRRFTISQLLPVFKSYESSSRLHFKQLGSSIEGRPIYLATFGSGPVPVLFWSQMHGDESTATMALLDFFRWLDAPDDAHSGFRNELAKYFTLYFIPMLNPDGVEKFQRRNAAHIDLNRDAIYLSSPESRILKKVRDSIEPIIGFNLHDQSIYYRAGTDGKQSAITFLAPAFDFEKNINGVRLRAMQIISVLNDTLQQIIPDRVATYDDTFEPRAFGDNTQKWGTSAILIESGGYDGDPEKQYLRKLNYVLFIKSLESVMQGSYQKKTMHDYESIPVNQRNMMSLKIKNLSVPVRDQMIRMDIGYLYSDDLVRGRVVYNSRISDVGDLSIYDGFREFDAAGMEIIKPKWYEKRIRSFAEFKKMNIASLVKSGYIGYYLSNLSGIPDDLPLILTDKPAAERRGADPFAIDFQTGRNPVFILQKGGKKWVVENGTVYEIERFIDKVKKAME